MNPTWLIYKKELQTLFQSPLFYIMAFLTTLLLSIGFVMGIQNYSVLMMNAMYQYAAAPQQLNIHYAVFLQHLSFINMVFIFFTPALSMKLLSEEKKLHSFELLMTSPVTSQQIVLGKYLAMATTLLVLELIGFLYILIASGMVDFNWWPTIITALGIYFIGLLYGSICLFVASLTENTMISFILGVIANLVLWVIGGSLDFIDQPLLKSIIEQISINQHLQLFVDGVIRTNSLVYFLSAIIFFCFLTERSIESSRWRSL